MRFWYFSVQKNEHVSAMISVWMVSEIHFLSRAFQGIFFPVEKNEPLSAMAFVLVVGLIQLRSNLPLEKNEHLSATVVLWMMNVVDLSFPLENYKPRSATNFVCMLTLKKFRAKASDFDPEMTRLTQRNSHSH